MTPNMIFTQIYCSTHFYVNVSEHKPLNIQVTDKVKSFHSK